MTCAKRRLLYACGQSYRPELGVAERDPEWREPPIPIDHGIDFALVGRMEDGVAVVFRGTLPPGDDEDGHDSPEVLLDWLNNGAFLPKRYEDLYPGEVHEGFAGSLDQLWDGVEEAVDALLAMPGTQRRLLVSGHSKGGAIANLFAWRAKGRWPDLPLRVFTIAAARAGNSAFAKAYEAAGIHCVRYEALFDAVPYVPFGADVPETLKAMVRSKWPRLFDGDYQPVGRRLPPTKSFVAGAVELVTGWFASKAKKAANPKGVVDLAFWTPEVVEAHRISQYSRYDALICDHEGEACGPLHDIWKL